MMARPGYIARCLATDDLEEDRAEHPTLGAVGVFSKKHRPKMNNSELKHREVFRNDQGIHDPRIFKGFTRDPIAINVTSTENDNINNDDNTNDVYRTNDSGFSDSNYTSNSFRRSANFSMPNEEKYTPKIVSDSRPRGEIQPRHLHSEHKVHTGETSKRIKHESQTQASNEIIKASKPQYKTRSCRDHTPTNKVLNMDGTCNPSNDYDKQVVSTLCNKVNDISIFDLPQEKDERQTKSVGDHVRLMKLSDEGSAVLDEVHQYADKRKRGKACIREPEEYIHYYMGMLYALSSNDQAKLYSQDADGDNILLLASIHVFLYLAISLVRFAPSVSVLNLQNHFYHQTALHIAVITRQAQLVRELVIKGASLVLQDKNGNTPLHIACAQNDLKSILHLTTVVTPSEREKCSYRVKQQIPQSPDIYNFQGQTCLHVAIAAKHLTIVRFLIESTFKANVNDGERRSGRTSLHLAVETGSKGLVKFLLNRKGIDVNKLTYAGDSALDLALGRGLQTIAGLLIRYGAEPRNPSESSDSKAEHRYVDDVVANSSSGVSDFSSMEMRLHSLNLAVESFDDICIGGRSLSDSVAF